MHPQFEGRLALDYMKFGLDVLVLVGYEMDQHPGISVREIQPMLAKRGVELTRRSIANLHKKYHDILPTPLSHDVDLDDPIPRYDFVTNPVCDALAIQQRINTQRAAVLDIFQLADRFGIPCHWVIREWLSGVLLRVQPFEERSPEWPLCQAVDQVAALIQVPITGFITDGSEQVIQYFKQFHWHTKRPVLHIPTASIGSATIPASASLAFLRG